jgi:hypothetical protein
MLKIILEKNYFVITYYTFTNFNRQIMILINQIITRLLTLHIKYLL